MSRPKKKPKAVMMSKRALGELESDIAKKMVVLSMAYLMDEFSYDKKALCDFYDGLERYLNAIDEKLITIKTVEEIIYEHCGIVIRW
jgi:hypothetical protein